MLVPLYTAVSKLVSSDLLLPGVQIDISSLQCHCSLITVSQLSKFQTRRLQKAGRSKTLYFIRNLRVEFKPVSEAHSQTLYVILQHNMV